MKSTKSASVSAKSNLNIKHIEGGFNIDSSCESTYKSIYESIGYAGLRINFFQHYNVFQR